VAIQESKLKTGKLVLGGTTTPAVAPALEVSCQPTNVRMEPSNEEEGDSGETLCGDTYAPSSRTTWALMGTAIQDWDAGPTPGGLSRYTIEHDQQTVDFMWQPNASTFKVVGKVTVRALVIGGDVNTRLTHDFEWPATNLTWTWPATALFEAEAETAAA
jgi:hypothetical protein